jgi:hypothetical protein
MVVVKIFMAIAESAVVGTMLGPALESLFMGSLVRLIQSLMFHIMFAVIAGMIIILMCESRQSRGSKQRRPSNKQSLFHRSLPFFGVEWQTSSHFRRAAWMVALASNSIRQFAYNRS